MFERDFILYSHADHCGRPDCGYCRVPALQLSGYTGAEDYTQNGVFLNSSVY